MGPLFFALTIIGTGSARRAAAISGGGTHMPVIFSQVATHTITLTNW